MPSITRSCPSCGKTFEFEAQRGGNRYYCFDCGYSRNKAKPKRPKACQACGIVFVAGVKQKYCSHQCRNEYKKRDAEQRRAEAAQSKEKHCTKCKQTLPKSLFRRDKNRLDGLYPWCIECWRRYTGATKKQPSSWSSKAEYDSQRREELKDQLQDAWFGRYLWTQYRLTVEQYELMLAMQGGRCAICKTADAGRARGRSNGRFHVDHDHKCCPGRSCGKCVRGLLCNNCNTGIGFLRDDPKIMREAIRYLSNQPSNKEDLWAFANDPRSMSP